MRPISTLQGRDAGWPANLQPLGWCGRGGSGASFGEPAPNDPAPLDHRLVLHVAPVLTGHETTTRISGPRPESRRVKRSRVADYQLEVVPAIELCLELVALDGLDLGFHTRTLSPGPARSSTRAARVVRIPAAKAGVPAGLRRLEYQRSNPVLCVPNSAPSCICSVACLNSGGTFPKKKNGPGLAMASSCGK